MSQDQSYNDLGKGANESHVVCIDCLKDDGVRGEAHAPADILDESFGWNPLARPSVCCFCGVVRVWLWGFFAYPDKVPCLGRSGVHARATP